MAGPNGSVLENFDDFEMDDIDENDKENEDDGTINGLLLSRNKQRKDLILVRVELSLITINKTLI
jgi:hypothetical protein